MLRVGLSEAFSCSQSRETSGLNHGPVPNSDESSYTSFQRARGILKFR